MSSSTSRKLSENRRYQRTQVTIQQVRTVACGTVPAGRSPTEPRYRVFTASCFSRCGHIQFPEATLPVCRGVMGVDEAVLASPQSALLDDYCGLAASRPDLSLIGEKGSRCVQR
jgi:hypothetical protein